MSRAEEFELFLSPNGGRTLLAEEWVRYFKKECTEKLGHKPSYEELKKLYAEKFNEGYVPIKENNIVKVNQKTKEEHFSRIYKLWGKE